MLSKNDMFSKEEAEIFVNRIAQELYTEWSFELISKFYTEDFVGYYQNQKIYLVDFRKRLKMLSQNTKNFSASIRCLYVINDLIVFFWKENWLNRVDKQLNELKGCVLLRVRHQKICEAWFLLDQITPPYEIITKSFEKETKIFEKNQKIKQEYLEHLLMIEKSSIFKRFELCKLILPISKNVLIVLQKLNLESVYLSN